MSNVYATIVSHRFDDLSGKYMGLPTERRVKV